MTDRPAQTIKAEYKTVSDGVVHVRRLILPDGMTLEVANAAADHISKWEDSDRSSRDLAVELYLLFNMASA